MFFRPAKKLNFREVKYIITVNIILFYYSQIQSKHERYQYNIKKT